MSPVCEFFLYPLSPVLSLATAAVGLITLDCVPALRKSRLNFWLALLGTLGSLGFVFLMWRSWPLAFTNVGATAEASAGMAWLSEFSHSYRLDAASIAYYAAIALFTGFGLVLMDFSFSHDSEVRSEVFILTLLAATGMMLLVSADSLLMVFLALELLSLPIYVMVGINRKDRESCEAALKYFLFGSFATVLLVFGIALLYAHFGTLEISRISEAMKAHTLELPLPKMLCYGGLSLIVIAVGFKIGLAPFHMWVPDAYQGAPTAVTAFMGSAVKLAAFGLAMRVFWGMFLPLADQWADLLNSLAVLTMFVGNLAALAQDNLKRLFAYSSVAHAGYLCLALGSISKHGPSPDFLFFYLVVYGLMFMGLFAIITLIERRTATVDIYQLSGMGFTHPFLGAALAIFVLSAAGIPPTAGFLAKYLVFMEAVRAGKTGFVIGAVISSAIGAYYYLRVLVYLYMKETKSPILMPERRQAVVVSVALCAMAVLALTVMPFTLGWLSPR